jgi:hypothetical protein
MQHEANIRIATPPNRRRYRMFIDGAWTMPPAAVTDGRGDMVIERVGGLRPSTSHATKAGRVSFRRTWCSRKLG